jgi:hypothetical protein
MTRTEAISPEIAPRVRRQKINISTREIEAEAFIKRSDR